ncbi:MAG: cupin domain-containing protein [Phycisphaerales bacterium]|nr:cupin domain-containing protein [Phycisphaerales bacterium]
MSVDPSTCFFSQGTFKQHEQGDGGSFSVLTSKQLPGLGHMSVVDVTLSANGFVRPGWHTNAQMIGYCTAGELVVTVHGPSLHERFRVGKGEIFYVPQGAIHHIVNACSGESVVKYAFNHHDPETMSLHDAVLATSSEAIQSTMGTGEGFLDGLRTGAAQGWIGVSSGTSPRVEASSNRFKFNIEASDRVVQAAGGYLQAGLKDNLPVLDGVGILGFGLNPGGAVEPHWHPNSDEIVYITSGRAKAMLVTPFGEVEVQEIGAGGGFYAPASFYHSIEQVGSEDVEGIAFFNNAEMVYVGLGEALGAFDDDVLSATFNVEPGHFKGMDKPGGPKVIVPG